MRKIKFLILFLVSIVGLYFSCKEKEVDTPTKGKITVLVDDNIFPIVDEQKQLFEFHYPDVHIDLKSLSDKEISKQIIEGKTNVFVLSRDVNDNEKKYFNSINMPQKQYPFAYSAIAFITNKNSSINQLNVKEVEQLFSNSTQKLLFDNANSYNLNYFMKKYKVNQLPNNISALQNNKEVIDYVSKNKDFIGVVDLNWISYPDQDVEKMLQQIKVISIVNEKNITVKPEQITLADQSYPFVKKLQLHSFLGRSGLGVGFGAFITGDIGQRIILKSGIQPYTMPSRELYFKK